MEVRSLRYAITLADELHFGRAASRHFIAAQPFGRRIQELERELGTQLFDRTSRRVSLTPAGERFLQRARRAVAQIDELMAAPETAHSDAQLRVGVLGYGLAHRWSSVCTLLAAYNPNLKISYVELDWNNEYDAVRDGYVDVAIVHDVGGAEDLRLDTVMESPLVAVVPAKSDLAAAERLTEADLWDRPRIHLVGQPGLDRWADSRSTKNAVEVRSPAGLSAAVAMTGHIALHGEPAARWYPHPEVRYIPAAGPHGVIAIASRPTDRRDAVQAFRDAVCQSLAAERAFNEVLDHTIRGSSGTSGDASKSSHPPLGKGILLM